MRDKGKNRGFCGKIAREFAHIPIDKIKAGGQDDVDTDIHEDLCDVRIDAIEHVADDERAQHAKKENNREKFSAHAHAYTFFCIGMPKSPDGLKRRMTRSRPNTIMSL
jgi:hypothetical protein